MHVFFVMKNENDDIVATSEQMLMGMDMDKGRPREFPEEIYKNIDDIAEKQNSMPVPK